MFPKLNLVIAVVLGCSCVCFALSKRLRGHYTIVAPGTVRSNSLYQLSISLNDYNKTCQFRVAIKPSFSNSLDYTETVQIEPNTTKLVTLHIRNLKYDQGYLEVTGTRGIKSSDQQRLNIEDRNYTLYIQSDKAKYKPGELVQFRVICIDRLTLPVNENIDIQIYDADRNMIKSLSNIELLQGVFKGDLQLSEYPVLGEWRIDVKIGGILLQHKQFQVAKYVLPSFSVNIACKKNVPLSDGEIEINVKTSYIYDRPVKGNLGIFLSNDGFLDHLQLLAIDGEASVKLNFTTDLGIPTDTVAHHTTFDGSSFVRNIVAKVYDNSTKQISEAEVQINIHKQTFKIAVIKGVGYFNPNHPVDITVLITDLDGNPIRDTKNPVTVTLVAHRSTDNAMTGQPNKDLLSKTPTDKVEKRYLDDLGTATVSWNLANETFNTYDVVAEYKGIKTSYERLERGIENAFVLNVLTKTPEVGKELVIELKSIDVIDYFVYEIVSRGDIIHAERVNVPGDAQTYLLKFKATYAMVPKITLFVHRVKQGIFDSRLKDISIKRAFQNSIKINTDSEVKPGESVSFNITTDEGSYVGLIGIDQKLLLDGSTSDDLTEDNVYTKLRNFDSLNMDTLRDPALAAGLLTFSNSRNRAGIQISEVHGIIDEGISNRLPDVGPPIPETPKIDLPRLRALFSETWLFKDFERTSLNGLSFKEPVPDSITSWVITGFSLNSDTGLSLVKDATRVRVFQRFFIEMDLPSNVKEGEIIEILVYVSNYMEKDIVTDVSISSESKGFEFLDIISSTIAYENQTITQRIPTQEKVRLGFLIRAPKSGYYDVTVKALSPEASDAIQKKMTVKSDGVTHSISKTYLVHFLQDTRQDDEIPVEIPKNAVLGSSSVQLTVVGDIFGPLRRYLSRLVHVPFGSGKDNMQVITSNLLALKYLKTLDQPSPKLEDKAKVFLRLGYQTQLKFKKLDGSFSLFNGPERTGDIWLTAYVIWGFRQARHFIQLDTEVIKRGLNYLRSKQEENGRFNSGKGIHQDVALTALVTLAFLVDDIQENQSIFKNVTNKSLSYIYDTLDDLEDPVPTGLSTYALVLGMHTKYKDGLNKLSNMNDSSSRQLMWVNEDTLQASLQTTAATFLNLLESQMHSQENFLQIVKGLISTEETDSIPAHMIALEAMIKYAQNLSMATKDLTIRFSDNKATSGDVHVNPSNAHILQTIKLAENCRKVNLKTEGDGFAVVNLKYRYNLPFEDLPSSQFVTNVTVKESTDRLTDFKFCVALRSLDNRANLTTALRMNLQSGHIVGEKTLEKIQNANQQIKLIRTINEEGSIMAFIQDVDRIGTCIQFEALRHYNIFDVKASSVVAYDANKKDYF